MRRHKKAIEGSGLRRIGLKRENHLLETESIVRRAHVVGRNCQRVAVTRQRHPDAVIYRANDTALRKNLFICILNWCRICYLYGK